MSSGGISSHLAQYLGFLGFSLNTLEKVVRVRFFLVAARACHECTNCVTVFAAAAATLVSSRRWNTLLYYGCCSFLSFLFIAATAVSVAF